MSGFRVSEYRLYYTEMPSFHLKTCNLPFFSLPAPHGEMTDMKGRKKDERKSADTRKVKGKPLCIEGLLLVQDPETDLACPLWLEGWRVERVGFVKLSEHRGRNKYQNAKNEDFSLGKTMWSPVHSHRKKEWDLPQLMIRLQCLKIPKSSLQLLSLQTCCCQLRERHARIKSQSNSKSSASKMLQKSLYTYWVPVINIFIKIQVRERWRTSPMAQSWIILSL